MREVIGLSLAIGLVFACREPDPPAPADSGAPACAFTPDSDYDLSTVQLAASVPGCPVPVYGWSLGLVPVYRHGDVLCQSSLSVAEAEEQGIFAALGMEEPPPWTTQEPTYERCQDTETGEWVDLGIAAYTVQSLTGSEGTFYSPNHYSATFTWVVGAAGLESVFVETDVGPVDCGSLALTHRVAFGEPLLTPQPRSLECAR